MTAAAFEVFDLTVEPWIPIVRHGVPAELSLTDTLLDADDIELANTDPLEAVALLRHVLLPVYWRSQPPPRTGHEWRLRWTGAELRGSRELRSRYLREHRARFELFGAEPFGQVASLRTQRGAVKSAAVLVLSMPMGNNVPLFDARTDDDPPALSPGQAARALLTLQCWDTAGLKSAANDDPRASAGKTYGNPTGPLGQFGAVVPLGRNLAETLLLNTPVLPDGLNSADLPPWEKPPSTSQPGTRAAIGPIDLLTWQARRVRLFPSIEPDGRTAVRHALVTRGDHLTEIPSEHEPHAMWSSTATAAGPRPIRHQLGRQLWREAPALLATTKPTATGVRSSRLLTELAQHVVRRSIPLDTPIHVLAVGISYGSRLAVIDDAVSGTMPLPLTALLDHSAARRTVLAIAAEADRLRLAVIAFANDLRAAAGARPRPWEVGDDPGEALMFRLTVLAEQLLRLLQRRPECAQLALRLWRRQATQLGFEAAAAILDAAPDRSCLGVVHPDAQPGRIARRQNASNASQWFHNVVTQLLATDGPGDGERRG
ncbi:type I-E CRISPR-associated protein Cse1/CasA [Nocardia brasiliensis]|uniref:type I-E CRISPR-associated protein Cse1/CasA n=1 Tax=Nocardia brasiliensis TaxID=37326 RepID=UPI003D8FDD13